MTSGSPTAGPSSPPFDCCAGGQWSSLADLGPAAGFDFILGRCTACDRRWMHLWSPLAPTVRYAPVDNPDAARLQAMPAGPARKQAVADWFELR